MADSGSPVSISEGDQNLFVACQYVVRALRTCDNLNADLIKLLTDLETHLSKITLEPKTEETGFAKYDERFKDAETKIMSWESSQSMLWDTSPSVTAQFLQAIYEVQTMLEGFKSLPVSANLKLREICNRADTLLQIAMSRLEKELCHILDQHKQCIQPKYTNVRSHGDDLVYDKSFASLEDESVGEVFCRENSHREGHMMDLIHPSVIPHIKTIANAMFACNYGQEFCKAFINIRKDVLEGYMAELEIEPFGIEDVLNMGWEDLNGEIKKWIWVLKIIIRVYLTSEKRLCEQILGDFESVYPICFIEISRASLLSLLNFGEGVVMGSHRPEKLIRLLDMYEVSKDIQEDIDHLLSAQIDSFLQIEFHELSKKLGHCARTTFLKFKIAVASDESSCLFPGGMVHPLTRYVMNYFMLLPGYSDILNSFLQGQETDDLVGNIEQEKKGEDISPATFSPMASHLRSFASGLVANLHRKAKLYQDIPLQHIFMINNLHYMVQKVKGSDLMLFFGDEWIRKHIVMYQRHATNYERATWSSVLSPLKDDSISVSQATLREKCKTFSLAFENVYENQTPWFVPDPELRDDLRISTSVKVLLSYRGFLGRNAEQIGEKHIRYTGEDLEMLLLDLFEGSPRSLRGSRRR